MSLPLPPGQRYLASFPRFGLPKFARRFPHDASRFELRVGGRVERELQLLDCLSGLPRVEQVSDVHCVTSWSRQSLHWGGVRFSDKSIKQLSRIEFRAEHDGYQASGFRFMNHPRARVALEERGRGVPGWLLRVVYRPLIQSTVKRFAKALTEQG